MVLYKDFHFVHQSILNLKKQATWNTSHLHGIAWSSEKLDYEKLFAVFYDIRLMNAEVFGNGLEKCRMLTNLLGRNVEKLDDYGCPETQDLVKTDSSWICSSYPFRHVFCICLYNTNLILSTRHDFFLQHSF